VRAATCVITGATSGIGAAAAVALAARGMRLALVCRDPARGEAAAAAIRTAVSGADVRLFRADLAVQDDVRRVARELVAALPAIHVLVNNAGVVNVRRTETPDGLEATFAVNHLAYYLLTRLLLDRLTATPGARVVNVASEAHRWAALDLDDLGWERRPYRTMRVYGTSKLANVLFTYELARRLAGTGVTASCLHPGAVATGLGKNNGWWAARLMAALRPFFRTPAQGAATVVSLAASPDVAGRTGEYWIDGRARRSSAASYDGELARRLWAASATLTGLPAD
jgi:NAD(P)-dependent dehydrogenase (short-subunit alcohol dehydrogenase family)